MKPSPIVAALSLITTFAAAPALAADNLARFDGAFGSQPLRAAAAINTVFTVNPGGIPWMIKSLKADIKTDGSISARGEGLLLAGGNTAGARGGTRFVVASLFCRGTPATPGTAGDPIGPFNSGAADLDPNGDFHITGPLTDANGVSPPVPCGDNLDNRPVLLIRSATVVGGVVTPGNWFALGILKD